MKIIMPKLFELLKSFIEIYMDVVKKRSSHTINSYKDTIRLYLKFVQKSKNKPLSSLTEKDFNQNNILAFMEWLSLERENLPTTINQRLSHLRVLCNYLMKNDFISYPELNKINEIAQIPDKRVKKLIWLTIEELKVIISKPNLSNKIGIRDKFYIVLLYESGCRNQEILDLRMVDFEITSTGEATLHVIGKGKKYRVIPISKETVELFYKYCKNYHERYNETSDKYLFYTIRNGIKTKMSPDNVQRFLKKYENLVLSSGTNIPHLHPHLLRTTRAMHLYLAGVPLSLVADWLGHSRMETTRIYASATIKMKRNAVKKMELKINDEHNDHIQFKYENDEETLLKLCGLE
ncbi:MAG: tyrosine-type recombinase/integrase [Clostridiales bacterium]|nr:tyrosine-type recombinase/integrase [Clostridiales bacterium]